MNKKNIIIGIIVVILLGITSLLIYTSRAFYEVSDSFNFINSRYYEQTVFNFNYTGSSQTFTAPAEGYYEVELWGASGGSNRSGNESGGAYTTGKIYLTENEILYVYVGEEGKNTNVSTNITNIGGYNGGGNGADTTYTLPVVNSPYASGSGGGSTDIRLDTSTRSRIMVAAASGGGGYNSSIPGAGGALIGHASTLEQGSGGSTPNGGGASQTAGGVVSEISNASYCRGYAGVFYKGPNSIECIHPGGGGAGGYYSGSTGVGGSNGFGGSSGGGGSSYISGYAGVNSVLETGGTDLAPAHSNNTLHYSGKYFIDSTMKSGVEQMPNSIGGTMTGNLGNGKAKITYLGTATPEKTNTTLNNVRYIKDCVNGSTSNTGNYWFEIQAIVNGTNVAKGKTVLGNNVTTYPLTRLVDGIISGGTNEYTYTGSSLQCVTIDLGQEYNLDEVITWQYHNDGRAFNNNTLSVGATNTSGTTSLSTILINNRSGVAASSQGFRFSAWD